MDVTFISHAGADAGRPNIHELRADGTGLLLDCGGGDAGVVDELRRPEAVWISHAHLDHCGGLLDIAARWPRMPLLATSTTRRLLSFALQGYAGGSKERVEALARRVTTVPMRRFVPVAGRDDLRIMALSAGHVPGAAMAVVEWCIGDEVRRVLYTGDFCTHDQAVVSGAGIPRFDEGPDIDAVVSEAMLANDEEADGVVWADEAEAIVESVESAPGPVLVGVVGIGESVEVATLFERAGVETVVEDYLRPVFEAAGVSSTRLTFGDRRRLSQALDGGGVVVATGDQFRRTTTAGSLVDRFVGDPDATLVVLNRARSGTPAGVLVDSRRGDEIEWRDTAKTLEARIVRHRLLNHAPRWQLTGLIEGIGAPKTLLVHGPTGSRWGLKRALDKRGYDNAVEVVERGEEYSV